MQQYIHRNMLTNIHDCVHAYIYAPTKNAHTDCTTHTRSEATQSTYTCHPNTYTCILTCIQYGTHTLQSTLSIYQNTRIHIYLINHAHMYTHIQTNTQTTNHIIQTGILAYAHPYTHTYIHMHTYTYIGTHMQTHKYICM